MKKLHKKVQSFQINNWSEKWYKLWTFLCNFLKFLMEINLLFFPMNIDIRKYVTISSTNKNSNDKELSSEADDIS